MISDPQSNEGGSCPMPKVHRGVGRLEFSGAQQRLRTLSTSSLCHLGNISDCKICFSQSHSANSKFASDFGSFFLLLGKSLVYGTLTSSPFHCRAELGLNAVSGYKSHLQCAPAHHAQLFSKVGTSLMPTPASKFWSILRVWLGCGVKTLIKLLLHWPLAGCIQYCESWSRGQWMDVVPLPEATQPQSIILGLLNPIRQPGSPKTARCLWNWKPAEGPILRGQECGTIHLTCHLKSCKTHDMFLL